MCKRVMSFLFALALMPMLFLPAGAYAANDYLIPDSDERYLSGDELWQWQYDALGYVLNEIFARHGFPFDPEGCYYAYFSTQSWYHSDPRFSYDSLSSVEWSNEHLIKEVRKEMRDLGTRNEEGMAVPDVVPPLDNIPDEFEEYVLEPEQYLSVYSGPGEQFFRNEGGNAAVSSEGRVYVYGQEKGWLMILYRLNNAGARIGYVKESDINGDVYADELDFAYQSAMVTRDCPITDDPVIAFAPIANLMKWDAVTYLCTLHNDGEWAYVEANTSAGLVRGCIPLDALAATEE